MTIHMLVPLDKKHEVRVGFDRPLQYYFLSVFDLTVPKDQEDLVLDINFGCDGVDTLLAQAKVWAHLDDVLRSRLVEDEYLTMPRSNRVTDWRRLGHPGKGKK